MSKTIILEAVGDPNLVPSHNESEIYNEDFKITGKTMPVGDGRNELTKWFYDLSVHEVYKKFDPELELETAVLTLTLKRAPGHFFNDSFQFQGLPQIYITEKEFGWVSIGVPSDLKFNLLDHYTSGEIFSSITGDHRIYVQYQDDALVEKAVLLLSQP